MKTQKNNPMPGEIWTFTDNSMQSREALILAVYEDGYAEYCLLHAFKKGQFNVEVASRSGIMYCDPRKISYKHTDTFTGQTRAVSSEKLEEIRLLAMKGIGVDPNDPSGLEDRLKNALASVDTMRKKIEELRIYKVIYEQFLKACADAMQGKPVETVKKTDSVKEEVAAPPEEPKPMTRAEKHRIAVAANREKYGPKQSYISEKLKSVRMTKTTLDRLIGKSDGCVSHWVRGDAKANWEDLERIFPGIEKEAETWANKQKGKN